MTLAELVTAVGEELGIIGAGQTVSLEDDAMIKRRYERVRAFYAKRNWIDWDTGDEIPEEAALAVPLLVAYVCTNAFGLPENEKLKQTGERWLADYRRDGYTKKTARFRDY